MSSKTINYMAMGIIEPKGRMQNLVSYGNVIEVDPKQPINRYYRSGTEMLRMAQVYLSEENHENAFILYMKYLTLFVEKIRTHPDYASIKTEMKAINKRIKDEVMPTSEKLRVKLLDRYQREYELFLANKEAERARELEREKARRAREAASNNSTKGSTIIPANLHVQIDPDNQPSAPDLGLLDQVVYPNDFPTGGGQRSNLLLPSDSLDREDKRNNIPSKPSFDRSQKPQYDRSDSLLAGSLRTVVIPQNTMDVFLQLAKTNTAKNVETCGILAGSLAKNRLHITHIIIPKQQGTPDSCTTMNEEEIFEIQDEQNLITLGWIHTHPSQTAFLSSVDLHTHCSYQIMMPEAIAIVCAPKYQTTGFFILTPNYGLNYIAECRQSGFHPHPNDPPLFMEAQHIQMDAGQKIKVVDLRR
ncbi:STAM-binding protein [Stomoxys calcitrans]|uniref:MPN domain-containing protein n=1 Tax=Stomoxys calcitrans TaxID=35570 RepID=A0A1I8PTP5_STOCA|nr:STAM-binding protein [Stomoxys calcitrans]